MVTETLTNSCGQRRTTSATTLDLPTPEGPARTVSRGLARSLHPGSPTVTERSLATELGEQRLALALTKPAQPPTSGDLQSLHDLLGTDLAHAGQGLQ